MAPAFKTCSRSTAPTGLIPWQFDPERLNPVWDDREDDGSGKGNIFSINTDGTGFQNLFSFNGTNGAYPYGDLTLSGSTLYGMTYMGGSGKGNIFRSTPMAPAFRTCSRSTAPTGLIPMAI